MSTGTGKATSKCRVSTILLTAKFFPIGVDADRPTGTNGRRSSSYSYFVRSFAPPRSAFRVHAVTLYPFALVPRPKNNQNQTKNVPLGFLIEPITYDSPIRENVQPDLDALSETRVPPLCFFAACLEITRPNLRDTFKAVFASIVILPALYSMGT